MITQYQYNSTKKRQRDILVKINLLNSQYQVVDEVSGVVVEQPTFTNDSNSDIRRTCDITFTPTDSSFDIVSGSKIWLDKMLQIYIGIDCDNFDWNTMSTNMGIYVINEPNQTYSATQNTISIQGLDLMCKLTGLRNGNLENISYVISQDTNVRSIIIATLIQANITKYQVEEMYADTNNTILMNVPNEIRVDVGGTVYDLLTQLRDISQNYQMYFDVDGVFCFNKIPNGKNEQIMIDDDIFNNVVLSYSKSVDYSEVKNVIDILGKTHEVTYYGDNISQINNIYTAKIDDLLSLENNTLVGFTTENGSNNPSLKINDFNSYQIKNEIGEIPTLSANEYYTVMFKSGEDYFTIEKIQQESSNMAELSNSTYIVSVSSITELTNGTSFTFKTPTDGCNGALNPILQLNSFDPYLMNSVVYLENNTSYSATFVKQSDIESMKYYKFLGGIQARFVIKETNPNSPFYIGGDIGEIRKTFNGGIYDNINSDYQAQITAKYLLYENCRLNNSVTITCVPIYWADVNWVVEITLPNNQGTEITEKYIIKSINTSDTQTINLMKYYPLYVDNE